MGPLKLAKVLLSLFLAALVVRAAMALLCLVALGSLLLRPLGLEPGLVVSLALPL